VTIDLMNVTHRYGGVTAVDSVSLTIAKGTRHALIGPNGAGKSTLFAMIAGALRVDSGRILLDGRDITRWPDHKRARAGLGRSYQTGSLFKEFTCLQNVAMAVQRVRSAKPSAHSRRRDGIAARAAEHLDLVGLLGRENSVVGSLSHGERRQLEVAMALATEATTILFDEPCAGMSAQETDRFVELIHSLPSQLTLLLVEHDLDVAFELTSQVSVLSLGRLIFTGSPDEARRSADIQKAYLGTSPGRKDRR
jgi:branched-chain amino acid transport system ATP-binding protein